MAGWPDAAGTAISAAGRDGAGGLTAGSPVPRRGPVSWIGVPGRAGAAMPAAAGAMPAVAGAMPVVAGSVPGRGAVFGIWGTAALPGAAVVAAGSAGFAPFASFGLDFSGSWGGAGGGFLDATGSSISM